MKINMKAFFLAMICLVTVGSASANELKLDRAPNKTHDMAALQNGAKLFVNYCLSCHSASAMRYNRLKDIGLTDQQVKDNLLFTADKVGEPMRIAMTREDAKAWFGVAPPDLSVIARSRASEAGSGADWLYTYLRKFYRDDKRPTGWNNIVFENVGMPHVLVDLQGEYALQQEEKTDLEGNKHLERTLKQLKPGKLSPIEYDHAVADLVSFIVYMGEPIAESRKALGIGVLLFLAVLLLVAYLLKREYWKDIH